MKLPSIAKNGVYSIPIDEYHGQPCDGPSISSSGLRKIFQESPAHFWATSSLNPDRIVEDESDAFTLGRAAHHLLLGEDNFSTRFTCRPDQFDSWRTKEAKQWRDIEVRKGRTVLLPSQLDQIRGMARSLAAHPLVRAGILNGEIEKSLIWRDKDTGIWLKARPDAIPNDSGDYADLKTTPSVRTEALEQTIGNFGYHQQGALIAAGHKAVFKTPVSSFSLVFVEKDAPWCVRVVTLKDDDLARGARQNAAALKLFATCLREKQWPGPGRADAEYLGIPSWTQKKIDEALEQMEQA